MYKRRACLWGALVLCGGLAAAPQSVKSTTSRTVHVDVLVTTPSGEPVADLEQLDFTLWDNNVLPMKIMSFKLVRVDVSRVPEMTKVSAQPQSERHGQVLVYELTFDAPVANVPNEYHSLGVKVDRPNLNVIARQGYYAQP